MGNKLESDFIYEGYRCIVLITGAGHRCGYVGIPQEHPLYKVDYNSIVQDISVHGGITYSENSLGIIETKDLWWYGFDCAHYNDAPDLDTIEDPRTKAMLMQFPRHGVIRTREYCETECRTLVDQLKEIEENQNSVKKGD